MKLKKIFALCISAALMMTGCIQKNDDVELSEEEMEHNAVIGWFENDIFDNEEFTDLTDYQYYARTIGLEKDELLSPDMWEVYYSESININKEIDGSAVYLIRLNPDKLLVPLTSTSHCCIFPKREFSRMIQKLIHLSVS